MRRSIEGADLSIERDGFGLALGADAARPRRVAGAAGLDVATDVVQVGELAAVQAARQFAQVGVERHELDLLLLQVRGVVRLQRQAPQTRRVVVAVQAPAPKNRKSNQQTFPRRDSVQKISGGGNDDRRESTWKCSRKTGPWLEKIKVKGTD